MDTSDNMDSLDDSPSLPELSFDDLLDPSPIKKSSKSYFDDDAMELDSERKSRTDDTLNTPGPKKPPIIQKPVNSSIAVTNVSKVSTPVRTQAVKLGSSPSVLTNSGLTSTPVLLNSKNILPKSPQILNNSIKLTQKVIGSTANFAGKTAIRTANGQLVYIQKTQPTSNNKTSATTNVVKTQNVVGSNSKPMTIQVLRTADGSYVPLKTTTPAGTNVKTTLTLSPTSLAGKKIITSSGGQVIIKGTIKPTDSVVTSSLAKTITTNAIAGVKTVVKPVTTTSQANDLNKSKPFIVHGSGGKQIIVSNQNIVKLSPKTITTTAGGNSVTTTGTGAGQVHAIQIPGKIGVQYVRVLPNSKVAGKPSTSLAASAVVSTVSSGTTKTSTSSNQPMKILNALPQKFTVVQKGGTAKLLLAQKNVLTGNSADFPNKLQKTIVTVPTIKSLNEDNNKTLQTQSQQQTLAKPTPSDLPPGNNNANQLLLRKHKISEINSEIQRITTSADNLGPPETKKPSSTNRVVLLSNNTQTKLLNNSVQQPGRISSSTSIPTNTTPTTKSSSGTVMQVVNVTQNGKKLYTVLKPPSAEQKINNETFSVLKAGNQLATTTSTVATTSSKPLINQQQLIHQQQQQQQKLQQFKQQQQQIVTNLNANATLSHSSTYLLPIKIKEEPLESFNHANGSSNVEASASPQLNLVNLPSTIEDEDADALEGMVGGVRRKHCNCSKSQCLKLYCDCFANGEFCQDCTCKDCFNNLENEDERQRAIKNCLERNPNAFKPKITSSRDQADMRLHNKGCNCKRSGCLKNYCECFEAKIPCSSNCKCVGCRNVEDRPDLDLDPIDPKVMAAMTGASDKRSYEKNQRDFGASGSGVSIKNEKLSKESLKPLSNFDTLGGTISPILERPQCNFITQEVIDATVQCMITQADECEKNNLPAYQTERMVMEELGRCLVEIIDFSIRNTDNSYSQE